jgi:4-amino-4-deoxy-L-arabinose transferase-like glycosyltransferase
LAALLVGVYATTLGAHAQPGNRLTGAEAHVLMTTASIADDGDLDVRNQYADRAWLEFHGRRLQPTAMPDAAGRIVEPHGIGLPLLLAPAYKLGGATGVRLLLALLAATAVLCGAALARRIVPDPWATLSALAFGLSPPMVAASTSIRPEIPIAAALAGAAVLALRIRDEPQAATAFWAALLVAAVPWLGLTAVLPAIVVALALARWLRRRRRGLAGFVALEVVLTSAVVYITVNDRLFGGPLPYSGRIEDGPATGIRGAADVLDRVPRLADLLGELLLWAPVSALAVAGAFWLIRGHRERLTTIVGEHIHTEVVALFAALVFGAQLATAAFLAPAIDGAWFPTRFLVPVIPFVAAIAAWGLRRHKRAGALLAAVTLGITVWLLAATVLGERTLT